MDRSQIVMVSFTFYNGHTPGEDLFDLVQNVHADADCHSSARY
jgi:hypothetical protein